ncbi:MAG: protein GlmU [Desulfobacteraceae bacterium]|nr:protein GlmU [Desulfobacteraceae bacterium]MBC2755839.1 protein GlmU [Desulfobacteraceae bacterium]
MTVKKCGIIKALIDKGVTIPNPECVEIGEDVNPDRISGQGVVIHSGCKIFGKKTLILKGTVVGYEAPVTIENCQIGPDVKLNGGFFKESVFLKQVSIGSCAHVREGTIFEEYASAAHSVGVKQTILFPYVTLGSQINFCDCLMAGGTGKKNHSEVGSSYIHFNFTPQQDKATPSLIGDVPRGVMLNQSPIFLGGQGGLVGPSRIAYGVTIAAGTIFRNDELRENRLIFGGAAKSGNVAYKPGAYGIVRRIFNNNLHYIANLLALGHWYQHIRFQFLSKEFPLELYEGVLDKLDLAMNERIKRLDEFMKKTSVFKIFSEKLKKFNLDLIQQWPEIKEMIYSYRKTAGDDQLKNNLIQTIQKISESEGNDYIRVIKHLPHEDIKKGTQWLQGIVDQVISKVEG